jgi:cysteine desulfurase/selenocysteine lyase
MTWKSAVIRQDFPILSRQVHGRPLVYLDNAATTQKPEAVIEAISGYYREHNANVHRGVHTLSDESTRIYHDSRRTIAGFFGAQPEELILTRNATEALNLAALSWGRQWVREGDAVAVSIMEHHSNFVPWQQLAKEKGARFVVLPLTDDGRLDWRAATDIIDELGDKLKVLALTHLSNTLGSVNPMEKLADHLRQKSWRPRMLVVADAAQSSARIPLSLDLLGADALAFSGHKIYGPMGIGGLIVKRDRLEEFQPVLLGGGMIGRVGEAETTFAEDVQDRFTAGTPDVASAAGLAAACDYLTKLGRAEILEHERGITKYAYDQLAKIPEIELVGPRPEDGRLGSVTFLYKGVHAHDVAQILDREGVAVRSGHHCTMPLHTVCGWPATTRASFAVYTIKEEIDALVSALDQVKRVFRK